MVAADLDQTEGPVMVSAVITQPLFGLWLTLGAFQLALMLQKRTRLLVLQPVLVTTCLLALALYLLNIRYEDYRQANTALSALLGPTTVALAVPLCENLRRVRQLMAPLLLTLVAGGVLGVVLTLFFGWLLGLPSHLLMSLVPKSVTMPIAMPLAEQFGGMAPLAAILVMFTGVIGTALAPPLLNRLKVQDPAARGFTLGMNAHAIGTAHALQEGQEAGAFAALGMILLGLATAVLLPYFLS
jgi:predicted murein hydrolase (TIGR00659 family)